MSLVYVKLVYVIFCHFDKLAAIFALDYIFCVFRKGKMGGVLKGMPELLIHLVSCGQRRGMGGGKPEVHFVGFTRGKGGGVRRAKFIHTILEQLQK